MNKIIEEKLELLPDKPGVYKMYDSGGTVIYVGKALSLKNRVRQYFRSQKGMEPKVIAMVSHIADFEYVLTGSEAEAFAFESNLIKELRPRYNILLKDDKHFPYLRADLRQDYPRFEVVRRIKQDGARYFGPYISGFTLKESLEAIRDHFPIRHCKKDIAKAIARGERPCLMYHLGRCCAPCSGKIDRERYHGMIDEVVAFLEGNTERLLDELREQMNEFAEQLDFEQAAKLRDRISAISRLGEKQRAITVTDKDCDVFALCRDELNILIFSLFIRSGKVIGAEPFYMSADNETNSLIIESFIKQFYSETRNVPREILVSDIPQELDALSEWLSGLRGKKASIVQPQRGEKRKYIEMAVENGKDTLNKQKELKRREWERGEGALAELCAIIGLDVLAHRIECYDNSHIQGRDAVGGMIVFIDGKPERKEYRRFRIKAEANGDDYLAMDEVLRRRFKRAQDGDEKFKELPDLIMVDGGRGQLNVALRVLEDFGIPHVPAIGLAERNEEVILPFADEPLVLPRKSPSLHLLQRIRDESHRFAISYHRSLRQKNALLSVLSRIDGIGDKRRRALFDAFVTLNSIKEASIEDLAAVKGMSGPSAEAVYNYFHEKPDDGE